MREGLVGLLTRQILLRRRRNVCVRLLAKKPAYGLPLHGMPYAEPGSRPSMIVSPFALAKVPRHLSGVTQSF